MNIDVFIAFIIASAIIVAIPGPNVVLVINDSIRHGFYKSLITILGIKVGIALLLLISLSGLAALLSIFSSLFVIIKWTGVCYLIYLGISHLISCTKNFPDQKENEIESNSFFLKGFLVSVTNPKGLLFAGAFFPQFLNKQLAIGPQIFILCSSFLMLATLIEIIYAWVGDRTGKIVKSNHFKRITGGLSGAFLVLFGIGLAFMQNSGHK